MDIPFSEGFASLSCRPRRVFNLHAQIRDAQKLYACESGSQDEHAVDVNCNPPVSQDREQAGTGGAHLHIVKSAARNKKLLGATMTLISATVETTTVTRLVDSV